MDRSSVPVCDSFQSTLSQGERQEYVSTEPAYRIFQSTLSQGERPYGLIKEKDNDIISIHALARRATYGVFSFNSVPMDFNPRSRKESDSSKPLTFDNIIVFQSTLSQGERLEINGEQGDSTMISIHALARRATEKKGGTHQEKIISIHALARRATGCVRPSCCV